MGGSGGGGGEQQEMREIAGSLNNNIVTQTFPFNNPNMCVPDWNSDAGLSQRSDGFGHNTEAF